MTTERDASEARIVEFDRRDRALRRAAAQLLVEEFRDAWPNAWPTLEHAEAEVEDALLSEKLAFAALTHTGALAGWVGAMPQYSGHVWELHPLVVQQALQGRGIGRALVHHIERAIALRGGITLWLGTDDEAGLTSVGGIDLYPNVLEKLLTLQNREHHPFGFYRRVGFEIVGIVPDANGFGKPDLLMAKRISAGE